MVILQVFESFVREYGNSCNTVRDALKRIRKDKEVEKRWISTLYARHPKLETVCDELWKRNAEALETVQRMQQEQVDFWHKLYLYMCKICYISPEMFLADAILRNSIQIVKEGWVDFVAVHTVTDFECGNILTEKTLSDFDS